ncbi:MAG: hypothetical protein ABIP88_01675, partial [Candidatus Binatia bacterium]
RQGVRYRVKNHKALPSSPLSARALHPKPKYQAVREWDMEKSVEEAFHENPRNYSQDNGERPGFSAGYFQISKNKYWHCEGKANQ